VTFRYDDDVDYEPEEKKTPKRKGWLSYVVVLALAITGSTSAFLWRAYRISGPTFPSFASSSSPADVGDKAVVLRELQAYQQQITAQTQAATQLLGSQQAEIKRLSDQMTALGAKLDTLQRSVASAQVAPPAPLPKPIVPPIRKKPAVPKPVDASPAAAPPPPPLQLNR
jgi:hypothetical protein